MTSSASDSLHLLERINIDLQVQNSIVPSALSLARFKVSGKLPSLFVNISDTKYKALMRLIDVAIPKIGDDAEPHAPMPLPRNDSSAFPLPPLGIFGSGNTGYDIDDDDDGDEEDADDSGSRDDQFFEADQGLHEVSRFQRI